MTVSKLTAQWVEEAARLTEQLFPAEGWTRQDLEKSLSQQERRFFVAFEEGQMVGCAGLQVVGDQGDVLTVGVDPAYRRRGIATGLLKQMHLSCIEEGVCSLFLEVRAGNDAARALYENFGFALVSRRKNYYRDPQEDALIYRYEV